MAVGSNDGLGANGSLVPCPFCGGESGYTVHEGSSFSWRYLHCAACGETVAEARNIAKLHETPADSTLRYSAGDEAWQAAGSYAKGLRELADSESKRAVEYLRRAKKAEEEIERLRRGLTFAGWFSEHKSGMSYRLWEQGGHDQNPGEVALYF